jgi:hypothetical protein
MGSGFIVSPGEAELIGLQRRTGLGRHLRPYRNGRDLMGVSRDMMVIDLLGLSAQQVRTRFPEVYQHLLDAVKPERDRNNRAAYRNEWWIFGEPRRELRPALTGLSRYIATVETAKHRVFQFLDAAILPDNMIVAIASDDAAHLAVLSSRIHVTWATASGGRLGVGNDPRYSKSRCFDPFPFPDPSFALLQKLRAAGEELDAHRKRVLAEHPDLTLTGLYNVLDKLRAGAPLSVSDEDAKARGLVLILKELHETVDRLAAEAYGWPATLADDEVLARLVALNAERAREEASGQVRWLRPDYQIPRFAKGLSEPAPRFDFIPAAVAIERALPAFPSDRDEQPLAVEAQLIAAGRPLSAAEVARAFRRGGKRIEPRVEAVLTTLARYGWIGALGDGRYAARRAA